MATPTKENKVSESEAPITITLKAGSDYSAPWLVIRGYDPDDVVNKLSSLEGVIEKTLEAAGLFAAGRTLGAQQVATEAPAPQAAPAQKQGWGSTPAAQQQTQQVPQQRQGGNHPSAVLHPEGKQCEVCGNILEQKKTQNGKLKFQCSEWRWNNGSPNDHTMIWAN